MMKALIVDDESLVRERVRSLLSEDPDITLLPDCANGQQALSSLLQYRPELLFLDVQMPVVDGFALLQSISPEEMPVTVFITAFEQFALRAFEVHAADYILKPFDRQRFVQALQHAKDQVIKRQGGALDQRLLSLLAGTRQSRPVDRLAIKSERGVFLQRVAEIDWIESADNYVRLHVGAKVHLLRETLTSVEARLDPQQFLRIHRSWIVNLERVRELQPWFHGGYVIVMQDGTELAVGRAYRTRLQEVFGTLA